LMFVSCVTCCEGSGLCESWSFVRRNKPGVCDIEISTVRWPRSVLDCYATKRKYNKLDRHAEITEVYCLILSFDGGLLWTSNLCLDILYCVADVSDERDVLGTGSAQVI